MQSYAFFSNYQTFDNHIYDNFIYLTQKSQKSQKYFSSAEIEIY